jgi:hypothetical protein
MSHGAFAVENARMKRTATQSMHRAVAILLAAVLSAHVPVARAEIVDTDALGVASQAEQERAKVRSFMERADVKERLRAMGVSGLVAGDRVDALSEAEVHALAQRIDAMPAGGNITQQEWILIVVVAILLVLIL